MAAPAISAKEALQKKPEGLDLYARFALAGALGCSVTHGAFTPVDVYVFPTALLLDCLLITPVQNQNQDPTRPCDVQPWHDRQLPQGHQE